MPGETLGVGSVNAGAVNVLYGSAAGLQSTGVGGPDDQFWNVTDFIGLSGSDLFFGYDLSAADFNNDGHGDLAIGRPGENGGAVYVLYGSAAGLQATGVGGPESQEWGQWLSEVKDASEESDNFGWSVVTGDVNNDGRDDLAIGVPYEDVLFDDVGAVNVLYGSAAGLQADGVGGPDDQFWHQLIMGVEDVVEAGDRFGSALP